MPVNLILRVQEMDVPGGAHRLAQLLPQPDDGAIEAPQLLLRPGVAVAEHEGVVAQGLNLQEVVEGGNTLELRPVLVLRRRLEQLPRLTGGAYDQSLPMLHQLVLGHQRKPLEVLQVGGGNQLIEIFQPHLVFRNQDDVLGLPVGVAFLPQLRHSGVDGLEGVDVQIPLHHPEEVGEKQAAGRRVVAGPMVLEGGQLQMLRHDVQLVLPQLRQQVLGQNQGIHIGGVKIQTRLPAPGADKSDVELRVVGRQRPPPDKGQKVLQRLGGLRRALQHLVGDAGEGDDLVGEVPPRVHEGLEPLDDLLPPDHHRADLRDGLLIDLQAGSLDVKSHVLTGKRGLLLPVDRNAVVQIVDKIPLHAVENLDVLGGVPRVRKPLHHAVVGNGDGGMAPRLGPLDDVAVRPGLGTEGGERVHVREGGVGVELHPLDLGLVLPHFVGIGGDIPRVHQDVAAIPVELDIPLDLHPHSGLHVLLQLGFFLLFQVFCHPDGVFEVSHVKGQAEDAGTARLIEVGEKDLSRHDHAAHLWVEPLHGLDRALNGRAHDDLPAFALFDRPGLGRGRDRLMDGNLFQAVGLRHGGGQGLLFFTQIGGNGKGQVHCPHRFLYFGGSKIRSIQKGAQVPWQREIGKQFKKGNLLRHCYQSLSAALRAAR